MNKLIISKIYNSLRRRSKKKKKLLKFQLKKKKKQENFKTSFEIPRSSTLM